MPVNSNFDSRVDKPNTQDDDEIDLLDPNLQLLVRAIPHLSLLRVLQFCPVFSGSHNDAADWDVWSDPARQRVHINQFKMDLGPAGVGSDPTAILIVKSMLLTGFVAPNAQVLYLDRLIREAELLQAIARVNRTADGKDYGLVVDYYGVVNHLTEALAAYTAADGNLDDLVAGSLHSLTEEMLSGLNNRSLAAKSKEANEATSILIDADAYVALARRFTSRKNWQGFASAFGPDRLKTNDRGRRILQQLIEQGTE